MTDIEYGLLVFAAISFGYVWYQRVSERNARRAWRSYFNWVRRGVK